MALNPRGLFCEQKVADYFSRLGYVVKERRYRTPYAEVDLVLYSQDQGWLLVEVKSVSTLEWLGPIVSEKQARRLHRAFQWFCEQKSEDVQMQLAVVSQDNEIHIYEDALTDLLTP